MKVRLSFVTNSSSSSFTISKYNLTYLQSELIKDHKNFSEKYFDKYCSPEDEWDITDGKGYIKGYTFMNNFSMYNFLEAIGINMDKVRWGDDD